MERELHEAQWVAAYVRENWTLPEGISPKPTHAGICLVGDIALRRGEYSPLALIMLCPQCHSQIERPCLLGYIDKCAAPCVGRVDAQRHREIVDDFCDFLSGKTDRFARDLERQMTAAADQLDFERAARLRDDLGALKRALEKQAVVLGDGTDADVVAFADDDLEAAVQVFHVRGGRVRGQRGWIVEKPGDPGESSEAALVEQFLAQFYGAEAELGGPPGAESSGPPGAELSGAADESSNPVPKEVLVPCLPPNAEQLAAWLSALRGSRVALRVPRRGDKRALAETVHRNAREALQQHKLKRAGDFTARSAALQNIQESLGLAEAPLRIECVDISHVQGTDVVGSLVVFEDGLPRKSDYRHFAIREAAGEGRSDDVASIAEVTRRRFLRHVRDANDDGEPVEAGKRRFAYPPNLFVVDGGVPQVNAAQTVLDELGVTDVAVIGLAKRLEEVWVPGEPDPVILPRNSEGLYLLQRVRDEAHRFAISYHRSKRSKRMTASALDAVRGLGQARRKALVAHFGSVAKLRQASIAEITEVPGIGATTAAAVLEALGAAHTSDTEPNPAGFDAADDPVDNDVQQAL
jgi:excinuclease ABC subunit C